MLSLLWPTSWLLSFQQRKESSAKKAPVKKIALPHITLASCSRSVGTGCFPKAKLPAHLLNLGLNVLRSWPAFFRFGLKTGCFQCLGCCVPPRCFFLFCLNTYVDLFRKIGSWWDWYWKCYGDSVGSWWGCLSESGCRGCKNKEDRIFYVMTRFGKKMLNRKFWGVCCW